MSTITKRTLLADVEALLDCADRFRAGYAMPEDVDVIRACVRSHTELARAEKIGDAEAAAVAEMRSALEGMVRFARDAGLCAEGDSDWPAWRGEMQAAEAALETRVGEGWGTPEMVSTMAHTLRQCSFEGLSHHEDPKLIPSERLRIALVRARRVFAAYEATR